MKEQRGNQRIEVDGYRFRVDEIEWARTHVPYLQRLSTGNQILYWTMVITLLLGLVVYWLSFVVSSGALSLPAFLPLELTADFLYNLGIVLWTSVVLVFMLEVMVDVQRRQAGKYLALVQRVLAEQVEKAQPDAPVQPLPDSLPADPALADLARKLDLILARLEQQGISPNP